jgi:hypothetical protein
MSTGCHSWTPERTFICKENDTESESGSGIIIICTWICTLLLVCVYGKFYFSLLFSNVNFLGYVVSTIDYEYAVLVEWNWQVKTDVLGEKPLARYVLHDPQVLLRNWNQASLVRSYLNYGTPPDPSWKTIIYTHRYSKWSVLVTPDLHYFQFTHIESELIEVVCYFVGNHCGMTFLFNLVVSCLYDRQRLYAC